MEKKVYWAKKKGKDYLKSLNKKIETFYEYLHDSQQYDLYSRCVRAFMGGDLSNNTGWFQSSRIAVKATKSRKLSMLKTNQFRSLVKHIIQVVSSERPAFTCRAANTDAKSQAGAVVGNGIIDYYMREVGVEKHLEHALDKAVMSGEGWVHSEWNPDLGEVVEYDEKQNPIYEGQIQFSTHMVDDIIRDPYKWDDNFDWLIVRQRIDRFVVASRYPKYEKEILAFNDTSVDDNKRLADVRPIDNRDRSKENEDIFLYTMYHKKNEILPNGKMTVFIQTQILDTLDLPYEEIPLFALRPDKIINTGFGYSPAFDLIAPQQMLDIINSTIATNQAQKISNPLWTQSGVEVENVNGLRFVKAPVKPEPIDLSPTSQEIIQFKGELQQDMQLLSAISSSMRGNPQASLKSGAALALVTNQSLQYHSLLEASFNKLRAKVATSIIQYLKAFSHSKRVAHIVGEDKQTFVKEFTKDDLRDVQRVVVEDTNPLSKTIAGRLQIADTLLERGLIKTPEKYHMILETGNISQLTTGETTEVISIKAENEALRRGETIPTIITDNHSLHVREHKNLLSDPASRNDPELVQRVTAHINEHIEQAMSMPPQLAQFLRQEQLAQPVPMQAGAAPSSTGGGGAPSNDLGATLSMGEAGPPNMPNMPTDPLTGEQFQGGDVPDN